MSMVSTFGGLVAGLIGVQCAVGTLASGAVAVTAEDKAVKTGAVVTGVIYGGIAYVALKAAGELLFGED